MAYCFQLNFFFQIERVSRMILCNRRPFVYWKRQRQLFLNYTVILEKLIKYYLQNSNVSQCSLIKCLNNIRGAHIFINKCSATICFIAISISLTQPSRYRINSVDTVQNPKISMIQFDNHTNITCLLTLGYQIFQSYFLLNNAHYESIYFNHPTRIKHFVYTVIYLHYTSLIPFRME